MNAVEFIKKFGWEYAKHILTDDAPLVMDLNYADLKRYVDAYELVESYGGLSYVNFALIHGDLMRTEGLDEAIALVEEI